jgi:asparagine N-glycosylation enzyme membrane subunit Stt3
MTTAFGVVALWLLLLAGLAATKQATKENILTLVWSGMILAGIGEWIYLLSR